MASIQKQRFLFYLFTYIVMAFIILISLCINISRVPYHKNRIELVKNIQTLSEENRRLELEVASANRLSHIEQMALKLTMQKPSKERYIPLP